MYVEVGLGQDEVQEECIRQEPHPQNFKESQHHSVQSQSHKPIADKRSQIQQTHTQRRNSESRELRNRNLDDGHYEADNQPPADIGVEPTLAMLLRSTSMRESDRERREQNKAHQTHNGNVEFGLARLHSELVDGHYMSSFLTKGKTTCLTFLNTKSLVTSK